MLPYLTALFVLFWQRNNQRRWRPVFWGRGRKCTPRENPGYAYACPGLAILATPLTPGDLGCGFSDFEMTWLLYCAGAVNACNHR